MGWYALENIEEALQESKQVLFPFEFSTWAKLAVIILFTGYVAFPSFPTVTSPSGDFDTSQSSIDETTNVPEHSTDVSFDTVLHEAMLDEEMVTGMAPADAIDITPLFIGFFGMFVGIILFMIYVSSLFEFVLLRSLIEQDVKIIDYASENLWNGFQYFLYKLAFFALVVLAFVSLLVTPWTAIGLIPLALILLVVNWIVFHFGLLNMIETDKNIVLAFKESLTVISQQINQAVVYLIVKWFIGLALSIIASILIIMIFLTMLIPFLVVGFLVALISPWLLIPVGLFSVVVLLTAIIFIAVPFRVYLYTYIIQVYGDFFQ